MALQNSSIDTISTFLGKTFYIPMYQREYSWEEDELDYFWYDLCYAADNVDEKSHFFGQIVVHNDEEGTKKKYIIDGQQRTITSVIFLSVLKNMFEEIYLADSTIKEADYRKQDIEIKFIGRIGDFHLTLGQDDSEYFQNNIQINKPSKTKEAKKSRERIRAAYYYFESKIEDRVGKACDSRMRYEMLYQLYETFIGRFNVLYMEATKLDESFTIFETLNARGKDLETADLLKNFLYGHSSANIDKTQASWNSMLDKLNDSDATRYIRHFWNSRNEFTREKQLYKRISRSIQSPKDAKEFLFDLEKYSEYYQDLENPSMCSAFSETELIQSLRALSMLKAKSFYPVVLAMLQSDKYDEHEIAKVVREIETYIFRNFTICKNVANTAEVFFARLARDIYGETLIDSHSICQEIKNQMVSDKEFSDSFAIWTGKSTTKETIRYIFRRIHQHLDSLHEININNTDVHIEHIMPQNPKNWNVDKAVHDEYLWRLGNLALLAGKLNRENSNKTFQEKKILYAQSSIHGTKELYKYIDWTVVEIEGRQTELAQYAVKIWERY